MRKLLLLGLLIPALSWAQNLKVIDKLTELPIANVEVSMGDKTLGLTNDSGLFALENYSGEILSLLHPKYEPLFADGKFLRRKDYVIALEPNEELLKEVVLSVSRHKQSRTEVAQTAAVIPAKTIRRLNPSSNAELMEQTPGVMVQRSQYGGGSPVLRGFEANKVLLVIDGIRINNAIFRSGHLQNVLSLNERSLERTEVLFGPSSVMYGSDALGGVMHFYTKSPKPGQNERTEQSVALRYSTVDRGYMLFYDVSTVSEKWSSYTAVGTRKFGDLRMGKNRFHGYEDWGKLYVYGEAAGATGRTVINGDPDLQVNSGYNQLDLVNKVFWRPNNRWLFNTNIQFSNTSNIPRFDQLNDSENGTPEVAQWYYGPQKRWLAAIQAEHTGTWALADELKSSIYFQQLDESRYSQDFGSPLFEGQEEKVKVLGLNLDLQKRWLNLNWSYGIEMVGNWVSSDAFVRHLDSLTPNGFYEEEGITRYPDGGANMNTFAAYVSSRKSLGNHQQLEAGLRYTYNNLLARYQNPGFDFSFDEVRSNNGALTGSLAYSWNPRINQKYAWVVSSGFHAPNVDDLAKVFKKSGTVTVPNPDLKPEHVYSSEWSAALKSPNGKWELNPVVFYSFLSNAIVKRPFELNGSDSVNYLGGRYPVFANTNAGRAQIVGGTLRAAYSMNENWSIQSHATYMRGKDLSEGLPLGHIPPLFGQTAIHFTKGKWSVQHFYNYHGWKRAKDYSNGTEDNLDEATPDGTPAWFTANIRAQYQLRPELQIQLAVENLLDAHYKVFASGISAPGRNIVFSVVGSF